MRTRVSRVQGGPLQLWGLGVWGDSTSSCWYLWGGEGRAEEGGKIANWSQVLLWNEQLLWGGESVLTRTANIQEGAGPFLLLQPFRLPVGLPVVRAREGEWRFAGAQGQLFTGHCKQTRAVWRNPNLPDAPSLMRARRSQFRYAVFYQHYSWECSMDIWWWITQPVLKTIFLLTTSTNR